MRRPLYWPPVDKLERSSCPYWNYLSARRRFERRRRRRRDRTTRKIVCIKPTHSHSHNALRQRQQSTQTAAIITLRHIYSQHSGAAVSSPFSKMSIGVRMQLSSLSSRSTRVRNEHRQHCKSSEGSITSKLHHSPIGRPDVGGSGGCDDDDNNSNSSDKQVAQASNWLQLSSSPSELIINSVQTQH